MVAGGLLAPGSGAEAAKHSLLDTPVYNEQTKSYFSLKRFHVTYGGKNWSAANKAARRSYYKGVSGRLAVVKSREVEDFLIKTFRPPSPSWIGLRFFCKFRKLVWLTGETHPLIAYSNWHAKWYRTRVNCDQTANISWMPVYLTPNLTGPRWQAPGPAKYMMYYFVEYPTGKK